MDGAKIYRFTMRWGAAPPPTTPRARSSPLRAAAHERARSKRCCRSFTGTICTGRPRFSAIKIDGERAYDLAREGETVELAAAPGRNRRLELVEQPDADTRCSRHRMRQGHLCALAGPRHGPRARLFRPRRWRCGAAAVGAVRRGCRGRPRRAGRIGTSAGGRRATLGRCFRSRPGWRRCPALAHGSRRRRAARRGRPVWSAGATPLIEGFVAVSTQGALVALAEVQTGELPPGANSSISVSHADRGPGA